jgi:16S rRNA processing protein RimM
MGRIGRPYGVRGLVRITSYADDLTAHGLLGDAHGRRFLLRWRGKDVAEVAEVRDGETVTISDRPGAEKLVNTPLFVDRAQLPEPEQDEFYLADLIGLSAYDTVGTKRGTVRSVHDYGAGASLEIEHEGAQPLLLPFTRACVPEVDVTGGRIVIEPPTPVDM